MWAILPNLFRLSLWTHAQWVLYRYQFCSFWFKVVQSGKSSESGEVLKNSSLKALSIFGQKSTLGDCTAYNFEQKLEVIFCTIL